MLRPSERRVLLAIALVVGGPLPFPRAWAAPAATDETPTPAENARALAAQGAKLFREHQYEAARDALARAYELDPQAQTLLKLGLAEIEGGHPVEALKHLNAYLARSDVPPAKVDAVRTKWLPQAVAKTARLDVFVRTHADIRVDGILAEPAPDEAQARGSPGERLAASIVVAVGEHDVSARDGALVQSQHVVATAGGQVAVHFQRIPDAPAAAPSPSAWASARANEAKKGNAHGHSHARLVTFVGLESAAVIAAGVAIGFGVAVETHASTANGLVARIYAETGGNSGCLPPAAAQCGQLSQERQAEHADAAVANWLYAGAGATALLGAA